MNEALRQRFDEAVKLKEDGDIDRAEKILRDLHQSAPTSPSILAVLGHVRWKLGLLEEAVWCFREAIHLRPNVEGLSLALFNTLWQLGRHNEAREEMRRFLAGNSSKFYDDILADIGP